MVGVKKRTCPSFLGVRRIMSIPMKNALTIIRRGKLTLALHLACCLVASLASPPVYALPCDCRLSLPDSSFTTLAQSFRSFGVANFSGCISAFHRLEVSAPMKPSASNSQDLQLCSTASAVLERLRNGRVICRAKDLSSQKSGSSVSSEGELISLSSVVNGSQLKSANRSLVKCCQRTVSNVSSSVCVKQTDVLLNMQSVLNELANASNISSCALPDSLHVCSPTHHCDKLERLSDFLVHSCSEDDSMTAVLQSAYRLNQLSAALKTVTGFRLRPFSASFLICNSMFSSCADGARLPSCPTVCRAGQAVLDSVELFANISAVPFFRILRRSIGLCSELNASRPKPCASPRSDDMSLGSLGSTISNTREDSRMQTHEKHTHGVTDFCFNTACPPPLRATSNSKNWDADVSALLTDITSRFAASFEDAALPLNLSLLPCGRDCVSVGFTVK